MNNQNSYVRKSGSADDILNDKGSHVGDMFDRIARRYDFLNHFLSGGIDRRWRKRLIHVLRRNKPEEILDVATGTGDLAIALARDLGCQVTGADISTRMMHYGRKKVEYKKLTDKIRFVEGAAEVLPFGDSSFDAVTVAFGVRNFGNLEKGLSEILRVLKPGGVLAVLEFSLPTGRLFRWIYLIYIRHVLPRIGKLISGDATAYTYLPKSIQSFPRDEEFTKLLQRVGYENTSWAPLTGGVVSLYLGCKRTL